MGRKGPAPAPPLAGTHGDHWCEGALSRGRSTSAVQRYTEGFGPLVQLWLTLLLILEVYVATGSSTASARVIVDSVSSAMWEFRVREEPRGVVVADTEETSEQKQAGHTDHGHPRGAPRTGPAVELLSHSVSEPTDEQPWK